MDKTATPKVLQKKALLAYPGVCWGGRVPSPEVAGVEAGPNRDSDALRARDFAPAIGGSGVVEDGDGFLSIPYPQFPTMNPILLGEPVQHAVARADDAAFQDRGLAGTRLRRRQVDAGFALEIQEGMDQGFADRAP